jgi:hypothetical protein
MAGSVGFAKLAQLVLKNWTPCKNKWQNSQNAIHKKRKRGLSIKEVPDGGK